MTVNLYKLMFGLVLLFSTFLTLSAETWFFAWVGLELNMVSFIPLLVVKGNSLGSEVALSYFLVQSVSSLVLLTSLIYVNQLGVDSLIYTMWLGLVAKLGVFPFYHWFPLISEGLSWGPLMILMSWQKLAPFSLIVEIPMWNFMDCMVYGSMIVGGLGGLNQSSLRKILSYSSINHLGWMMASIKVSEVLWVMYFLCYVVLTGVLVILFYYSGSYYMIHLYQNMMGNISYKLFLSLGILSLGGLPPLLGFFPKWLVVEALIFNGGFMMVIFMVMMTLISLYFYLRMVWSFFIFVGPGGGSSDYMGSVGGVNYLVLMLLGGVSLLGLVFMPLFL
uniref:NADH dehydrogenase subunit 2 n=1 Tax=Haplodiplatys aotouensis TaxID=2962943 RepID=UPI00211532DE|nr:NADH dehydrogenase subunit 2 [Haplodiplatys aotouensis]UTI38877.1 NADH dehydrogenase subunit 2 [Haplodiplatys aotouensis]UTI38890.1 NADH dehydrogenase subunit 2 [Haplodiplatys aotouensis]